tara:strand:+ start:1663 stop:3963 length:2301 start_codon:yes stop_codon:yes gene_type:complete
MTKKIVIFLISFAFLHFVVGASNLDAETFQIKNISVEGNNRISANAIVNYSSLNLNSSISSEDLSSAYNNILNTDLFRMVNLERRGDRLKIIVDEYPTVNEISFEGNSKITDKRLEKVLKIKPRYVFAPSILENDVESILELYKNFGRISAQVKPKVINLSDNRVNVIFEIYEGDISEIERISFVGNRSFSDHRLRRVLDSKQAGFLRRIISRDTLISERIAFDKKLLTDFYKSRGFYDFEIYDVSAELSEENDGFFVSYNIKEGPKFKLGDIKLTSKVSEISAEDFMSDLNIKKGQIYSSDTITRGVSKLERSLRLKGFNFVRIQTEVSKDMPNLLIDLELVLVRSERVFVERIDITGNTATLDRVLRRQFRIAEGDPFNPSELRDAEERIRALGLFSDVSLKVRPGKSKSMVVIDVSVGEIPTGSLSFGAGYSSARGLGGIIEYSERNFLGRGQSLSFAVKTGKDDQLYEFSFFEPMFLRNELGFGFDVSLQDTNKLNSDYDTSSIQFQPFLIFPIGDRSKLRFEYSLIETDLANPGTVGSIINSEVGKGKVTSSGLGYLYTNDTRLYKIGPKNGSLLQIGQQFLGLGADNRGIKSTLKAVVQRETLKEEVKLTAVIEAGNLSLDKGSSRVVDRFFLGPQKMRGFKPGGIGPRECSSDQCNTAINDALGGESFAVVRFEAEFPLGLPEEYGLSGGIFYDIGNLWSLSETNANVIYEEGSWRQAIGASIFWKTPIGPLRFNFTDAISKEVYDLDESFDLTISTRF